MHLKSYTKEFKTNFKLAWPVMVGYLGHMLVSLADNIMVGKLGPKALAAVSLGNSTVFFVMSFGFGFSSAITPLVSEALGAKNKNRIHRVLFNGVFVNTVLGMLMVLIITGIIPFLPRAKQPPEVLELAIPYIKIISVSVIFVMIFQAMKQFSDGLGHTKISMRAMIYTNILNIIFNYILIYGFWIIPAMGVIGAGIGTLISRFLILFVFFGLLKKFPQTSYYVSRLPKKIIEWTLIRKIISLGIPSGFQSVFEMGIFTASVWLAGTLGTVAQAANQIALQLASMTFMVFLGFSVAATVRVGYRFGKKDFKGLQRVAYSIFLQSMLIGMFFSLLYLSFRHELPWIYLSRKAADEDVRTVARLASQLLIIAALFQISDSLQVTIQGALRGLQDVKIPAVITFVAYWVIGFPLSFYGAHAWGVKGIWYGLIAGLSVAALLLFLRFYYLTNKFIHHENAQISHR